MEDPQKQPRLVHSPEDLCSLILRTIRSRASRKSRFHSILQTHCLPSPTRSLHELFSSRITWRTCIEPLPLSPTRSETVCEPCGFLPHLAAEGRRHSTRRSEEAAGLRVAETSRETSVSCRQDIISVSVVSTRFQHHDLKRTDILRCRITCTCNNVALAISKYVRGLRDTSGASMPHSQHSSSDPPLR